MSIQVEFGKKLKNMVKNKADTVEIGKLSHLFYENLPDNTEVVFLNLLLHLGSMELGDDFALSYNELDQIANSLIDGRKIEIKET